MGLDMSLYAVDAETGEPVEVIYWRKANAIHNWFVRKVQNGRDNCEEYSVTREKLLELQTLCKDVLANPSQAPTLLPTRPGFFFGSYEYDEYYFTCLTYTIEKIEEALADETLARDAMQFFYRSSW